MPTEAKPRFLCIECSVQVVVGSEAQVQSAAVRSQREQRLCTRCMHKRMKGTSVSPSGHAATNRVFDVSGL
jgi:hypothetical protein